MTTVDKLFLFSVGAVLLSVPVAWIVRSRNPPAKHKATGGYGEIRTTINADGTVTTEYGPNNCFKVDAQGSVIGRGYPCLTVTTNSTPVQLGKGGDGRAPGQPGVPVRKINGVWIKAYGTGAVQHAEVTSPPDPQWLVVDPNPVSFPIGPRLHKLIYEAPAGEHNPMTVIQAACMLWLHATGVEIGKGEFIVSGLDGYGRYHLRALLASYEDPK